MLTKYMGKFLGATFAGAPQPTGAGSTWSPRNRCSTVFRGWPILGFAPEEGATRTAQKWGFFRAVQLQTGANSYAATSTCRLGPIAVLVRALAYGRVFPQAHRGIMSPQGTIGGVGIVVAYAGEFCCIPRLKSLNKPNTGDRLRW